MFKGRQSGQMMGRIFDFYMNILVVCEYKSFIQNTQNMFSIKVYNTYFYRMKCFIIITDICFLFLLKKELYRLGGTLRVWRMIQ